MRTTTIWLVLVFSVATTGAFNGSSAGSFQNIILQGPRRSTLLVSKNRHGQFPRLSPPSSTLTIRDEKGTHLKASPTSFVPPHVWTSLLPPCMGFYKSEYTVSLGYGFGISLTAFSLLRQFMGANGIFYPLELYSLHAYALILYGMRLNVFLILRNVWSYRIQEFNTRIEDRAVARGNRWNTRAPFILSCGMLYYGLAIPLWFTGKLLVGSTTAAPSIPFWASNLFKVLIGMQWFGFSIAALGDWTKTYVKRSEKNERYLVTSGIFSFIRHPNYSGEILGWTCNALAGLLAASLWIPTRDTSPCWSSVATLFSNLGALVIGWIGILFVLLRATSNLEARQRADYGESAKYQKWVASSWGGWQLPAKTKTDDTDHEVPRVELDATVEEDSGSGI